MRVFERRFLPDESFVHTALAHSPFNGTIVNANLRWLRWPHRDGDPAAYWERLGAAFAGGSALIDAATLDEVLRSPHMFARKVRLS